MTSPPRVVFDCNVFLQALASPQGPSGRCLAIALEGKAALFVSPLILDEIRDVTSRPELIRKFRLRPDRVEALLHNLPSAAIVIANVPPEWNYDRDPDDAHYVNVAIAAGAEFIVSRDRDLLDLMNESKPHARDFQNRYPHIEIVDPPSFLRRFAPLQ